RDGRRRELFAGETSGESRAVGSPAVRVVGHSQARPTQNLDILPSFRRRRHRSFTKQTGSLEEDSSAPGQFTEIRYPNLAVRECGDDFESSTHGLHIRYQPGESAPLIM